MSIGGFALIIFFIMVKNFELTPEGNGNQSNSIKVILQHSNYFTKKRKKLLISKDSL